MVKILTPGGTDLVATPPTDQVYSSVNNQTVYNLQVQIVESNTSLPVQNLTGTIHWNDGGLPTVVNGSGTIQVDETRTLSPGTYLIGVAAHNYEVGTPSTAQVNFAVRVLPMVNVNPGRPVIYGPVLPRDQGYPGPKDWNLNTATNLFVLESSAKMLLNTAKGERVMEPNYGTNIRRLIFETSTTALDTSIQQEISEALALWEPRLELQFLRVDRPDNTRNAVVNCTLVSRVTGEGFGLTLYFQS